MAKKPTETAALAADPDTVIPRLQLGEVGWSGLRTSNKQILEEKNRVFQYPQMLQVVAEMDSDSTVSAAFNVYNMIMNRVNWKVCPPEDATDKEKERAKIIYSMTSDMENSWSMFVTDVLTYLKYGHSVIEKVFRRRLKKNGSKYNDGLVGLKKLAPRGQDTITKWYFSTDGRELEAIGQNLSNMENAWKYQAINTQEGVLKISRNKFLLFSADSTKGNPQGKSLLKAVYLPYKQLTLLKDQLMLGVAKDLAGIPVFYIPAKYLDPNASAEDKATYSSFKSIVDNLAAGTQRGVILPKIIDVETKEDLVSLELIEAKGGKAFDIPAIIAALQQDILTALSVDVIKLGQNNVGSFSLASSKENLLAMAIEYRLKEIKEVLNSDLMRQLYELNGWETDRMATFEYDDVIDLDMDEYGKYLQRVASVGLLIKDHATINKVRQVMQIDPIPEDEPIPEDQMTGNNSRSGDGMSKGSGNGTSDNAAESDTSSGNVENS